MKKKLHKILGITLTLVMAISLTFAFSAPAMAAEEEWDGFDVPDESTAAAGLGDAFMGNAIGSVGPLAQAIDGTLYLYVAGAAPFGDLFTSDDEGRTWDATDYITDLPAAGAIVAIATSSEDADILYVADATNVYKTDDEGDSWTDLSTMVAGTEVITCLDVGYADDDPHIFVGTNDPAVTYGEVYYYRDAPFASIWTDLNVCAPDAGGAINNSDVFGIAVSPQFEDDTLVVAVVAEGVLGDSYVTANEGAGIGLTAWDDMEIQDETPASFLITGATNPIFVDDFDIDDDYELFVGVSGAAHTVSGLGGVFRVTGMANTDDFLLDDVDANVASIDLVGDLGGASIAVGTSVAAGPASVWYSTDDGDSFDETDKAPTGAGATNNWVAIADDFADSGILWCASQAATKEGGMHLSTDFGDTFNGISMLDTDMDGGVYDVAFSGGYEEGAGPMFMVTESSVAAADDSVWMYDGDNWERVWYDAGNALDMVEVSPDYDNDMAVFIADSAIPTILYSHDGSADFTAMTRQPGASIQAWLIVDDETVITADDGTGTAGDVYKTTRYGRRSWDSIATGGGVVTDLAISPSYASDGTMLAGDAASLVFISIDEGEEWDELSGSDVAGWVTAANDTYVAFDPRYSDNGFIYAASDDIVARCEIDLAEDWDDQDFDDYAGADAVPGLATVTGCAGIAVADDGMQVGEHVATLYVADGAAGAGMWRSLNPTDDIGDVIFEPAAAGLAGAVDFSPGVASVSNLELTYGSNILYAIDTAAGIPIIHTYEDTLAAPVVLGTPANNAGLDETGEVGFEWSDLNSDTVNWYQIYVNEEDDFPGATDELIGTDDQVTQALGPAATRSARDNIHNDNELTWRAATAGTEYFWKVRVSQGGPVMSRWSEIFSFATKVAQVTAPVQVSPEPGAQEVIINPTFDWRPVTGADFYKIMVATDGNFQNIITSSEPAANVWASDVELEYSTVYYWSVQGVSFSGAPEGDEVISIFTTVGEPTEAQPPVIIEPTPPAPAPEVTVTLPVASTPAYVWAIIGIGALLVIALIVLIVRTRRVV